MSTEQNTPAELPIVVIVGRPNVGKSALFNRILGRRVSIVHQDSGVTRDRVARVAEFDDWHFLLVDTGGLGYFLDEKRVGKFDALIREQVDEVIRGAARVILVTDAQDGEMPLDAEIAQYLRRHGAQVTVAANKADNPQLCVDAPALFAGLGFPHVLATSCSQGTGIDDLLLSALAGMPKVPAPAPAEKPLRLTVVGRPNVGKSSLVNRLLGSNRMIVSEIPGTTRDTVDIPFELTLGDRRLPAVLVDTAGLRHKHKIDTGIEIFSVMRAGKAIERADLVLFVLEANSPPTAQDRRIGSLIATENKPCILVANKWDLVTGKVPAKKFEEELRFELPFMGYAPLVGVSALRNSGMRQLTEAIGGVHEQMQTTIPTALLNQFLHDLVLRNPPPAVGGKHFKIFYTTMISASPPRLLVFVNDRKLGSPAYMQFLETRVREGFYPGGGVPVSITLRDRPQSERPERGPRSPAPRPDGVQTGPRRDAPRETPHHSKPARGTPYHGKPPRGTPSRGKPARGAARHAKPPRGKGPRERRRG